MNGQRFLAVTVFALLALAALYLGAGARDGEVVVGGGQRPGAPRYARRGTLQVGMRNLASSGDAALAITAWYPAQDDGSGGGAIRYRMGIKTGAPLGTVAIATHAGEAIADAPSDVAQGPYPLVILSPGFAISSSAYGWLAEHLASYGFVVMAPEHAEQMDPENELWRAAITRPQDVRTVLATADTEGGPGGALEGLVDGERVAVVGHSYGGYTALAAGGARINTAAFQAHCAQAVAAAHPAAWLCEAIVPHLEEMATLAGLDALPVGLWPGQGEARVAAIVSLAGDAFFFGEEGLAEIDVPVLAIGGTADSDSPYEWGTYPTTEYAASARKVRIALEAAEHMIFTGPCERKGLIGRLVGSEFCTDAEWERQEAQDVVKRFVTAFLLAELTGDGNSAAALGPDWATFPNVTVEAQGYEADPCAGC